jgi:hypothetical protein
LFVLFVGFTKSKFKLKFFKILEKKDVGGNQTQEDNKRDKRRAGDKTQGEGE